MLNQYTGLFSMNECCRMLQSSAGCEAMESVRISVTVPTTDHHELERMAEVRRVSLAWVVREAITQYLAAQEPLFRQAR